MGSVIATSDLSGNLTEGPTTYDAFGNCFIGGSNCTATGSPFRFTGQRFDPETGCYYYRARIYCPAIGRFLQNDPVGYKDDLDLYSAFGNDPTNLTDPGGEYASHIQTAPGSVSEGSDHDSTLSGSTAYLQLAQAAPAVEGGNEDRDSQGEVGASAREFENNRERAIERENRERETERDPERPEVDTPRSADSAIDRAEFARERSAYWREEVERFNTGRGRLPFGVYTAANLARMREGKPPIGEDDFPMELHHPNGLPWEPVEPMTRTEHRLGPNYRLNHPWLFND